jgi:hypothetical protein
VATLVQFLAAGVNGAASGSATFVLRGTASSAAAFLYTDFEGVAQPGTNIITLDANGAAEVYCDVYCDVTLKNSAGATLRTVTVGNSAPTVEVQSTSFTGTDYDGSPANTAGEPITLKAVLDKWITSAGAVDWKVLVGGVSTNIQTALAGFAGMFVNVKDPAYGAVGDGVTDDTTAISAATTAANGGIVFFPPGTYKITTLSLAGANINWLGSGAASSIISGTTSTSLIALTNNTNTAWKNFTGLSFTSSGTFTRLFALEESQNVSFSRCSFDASQCSTDAIESASTSGFAKYLFSECDFTLGASTTIGIFNSAATAQRLLSIKDCNFKVPSGFTGHILLGPGMIVSGCRFDGSLVTSGTYHHISALDANVSGKFSGTFEDNLFIDGGSSGYAFSLLSVGTNTEFSESGNTFIGFTAPATMQDPGHIYDYSNGVTYDQSSRVHLGSREGKQLNFTNASAGGDVLAIECFLVADTIVVDQTDTVATVYHMEPAEKPIGLSWKVVVLNNSGGSRDISVGGTAATVGQNTVVTGGRAMFDVFSYLEAAGAADCDVISSAKAAV